ncbi:MAG: choice-of-anchor D domain-containing protein, partial [Bacteroidia bacterium]|nr:choice-of-anchor D domain-containing protein [Bacteroidia bacterium]
MKHFKKSFLQFLALFVGLFIVSITGKAQGTLTLKFFIQGYYLGSGTMNAPYFNANLSSNSTDVGFCTVDLIDPQSCLVVESMQGMLQTNGLLSVPFSTQIGSSYYVRVSHFNTIQTYSVPISLNSTTFYDYSLLISQAYGNNMIEIEPGVWGFYSGDINQDCIIDAMDQMILYNAIPLFIFDYDPSDLNGDGVADYSDVPIMDTNLTKNISCISPCSSPSPCTIFGDDYSTNTGWTQVGTDITVNTMTPGQVHFEMVPGASDHRVYKNIGSLGNTWMAEFDVLPISGSNVGVASMLMCLSAGSDIPYRVNPTGAFTDQDFISVEISSLLNPANYLTESYFFTGMKDNDNAPLASSTIPVPAWNVRYYIRLERFDATSGLLSIFSDADRTVHIQGSPVCLNINDQITGLTTLQHSNVNHAGSSRSFTGDVDNTCISNTLVNILTASITSIDQQTCTSGGCFHVTYSGRAPFTFLYDYIDPNNPQNIYTSPVSSSDAIFCNLPPGSYALVVRDACGNYKTLLGDITNTYPVANAGPDILTCDPNAVIALQGSAGISGVSFSWRALGSGSIFSGQGTSGPTVIGIDCYELTVTDPVTGCIDKDTVCVTLSCPANALDFDGVDDYVSLGNRSEIKPQNGLTVEVWLHQSDWTNVPDKTIVGNTQNGGYSLEFDPGNMLSSWVFRNGTYGIAQFNCTGLSSGWHHLAFTYDGRYNKLFIDGIMVASNDAGAVFQINYSPFSNSTIVGAEAFEADAPEPGTFCPGKFDELRIWSYARNCGEIMARKNCELTGVEGGLVAYYKFNQGIDAGDNSTELVLNDAASFLIHGQLRNFALSGPTSNWIAPGAVPSGITCSGLVVSSEIDVQGNSISIQDGDISPVLSDDTEFGSISTNSSVMHVFTILNTGSHELNISGITVTGGDFSVSGLSPASPIAAGASASFTVTFLPTSIGLHSAVISILSDDCDEPDYNFTIQGMGVACCIGNFIQNPGFTNGPIVSGDIDWPGSTVDNWYEAAWSPQVIVAAGCEDTNYIRMWGNKFTGESIEQILSTPIVQGQRYKLSFCARFNSVMTPTTADQFVKFLFRAFGVGNPTVSMIGTSINVTNTGTWVKYELDEWTANANYTKLNITLTNDSQVDTSTTVSWGEIDNICMSLITCDNFPQVDAGADQTICAGACVTISSPAYACTNSSWYQLPNFNFIGNGTSITVCPSSTTCYALIVNGAFGCVDTDTVCITIRDMVITCSGTNVSCNGFNDGSVCVTANCGTAPFTYQWATNSVEIPGATNPCMTQLSPGTYCVVVTDAAGNTATCCFTITQPDPVIIDLGPDVTLCNNSPIILTALSPLGNGATRDWYRLPGNIYEGSGFALSVAPTISTCYKVIETDANGCTGSDIVCVNRNSPPIAEWPLSFAEVCDDAPSFLLTGGMPSNSIGAGTV